MRRMNWISLLLTGALLTVLFGMGAQAADAGGDVNADGASDAEDVALLQMWCRLQLGLGFIPWPGNFQILWLWTEKKQTKKTPTKTFIIKKC